MEKELLEQNAILKLSFDFALMVMKLTEIQKVLAKILSTSKRNKK